TPGALCAAIASGRLHKPGAGSPLRVLTVITAGRMALATPDIARNKNGRITAPNVKLRIRSAIGPLPRLVQPCWQIAQLAGSRFVPADCLTALGHCQHSVEKPASNTVKARGRECHRHPAGDY